MTRPGTITRSIISIGLALMIAVVPYMLWQSAQGGQSQVASELAPLGIVVVGDSITARYSDSPGDRDQAWWSFVGRTFGAEVTRYAQSGSGYLRPGHRCTGDRFIDRTDAYSGDAPSIVLVEGGRNDWAQCVNGVFVPASSADLAHAVSTYLTTLKIHLPASTRIIVIGPPWGPLQAVDGERVTRIIQEQAKAHGLEFIDVAGALTADRVVDGVHPNRAGSIAIARRVIDALR